MLGVYWVWKCGNMEKVDQKSDVENGRWLTGRGTSATGKGGCCKKGVRGSRELFKLSHGKGVGGQVLLRKGDALWQKAEQVEGRSVSCGRKVQRVVEEVVAKCATG